MSRPTQILASRSNWWSALTDARNQVTASPARTIPIVDATPPTVQFTSPAANSLVTPGATVNIGVTAADNGAVAKLIFAASGAADMGETRPISPAQPSTAITFQVAVSPTATANQVLTLTVQAEDGAGNRSQVVTRTLAVRDIIAPLVALNVSGNITEVVQGGRITATVNAVDEIGVTQLSVRTQGVFTTVQNRGINPVQPTATFNFFIAVPPSAPEGSIFTVVGTGRDQANNVGASQILTITVIKPGARVEGLVTDTSNQPVAGAQITVTAGNGVFTTVAGADGRYAISGAAPGMVTALAVAPVTGLRGRANGIVAINDLTVSLDVRISDAPVVVVTAPLSGTTLIEQTTLRISATATDDVRTAAVHFALNGVALFTDTSAPYQFDYIVPVGAGLLSISADAVDDVGNIGIANLVQVTVIPDPLTTVAGRVVDPLGIPVASATLSSTLGFTATTDADGLFMIPDISTIRGDIQVLATASTGYGELRGFSAVVAPVMGGVTNVGDIVLRGIKVWDAGGDGTSWHDAANWSDDI